MLNVSDKTFLSIRKLIFCINIALKYGWGFDIFTLIDSIINTLSVSELLITMSVLDENDPKCTGLIDQTQRTREIVTAAVFLTATSALVLIGPPVSPLVVTGFAALHVGYSVAALLGVDMENATYWGVGYGMTVVAIRCIF